MVTLLTPGVFGLDTILHKTCWIAAKAYFIEKNNIGGLASLCSILIRIKLLEKKSWQIDHKLPNPLKIFYRQCFVPSTR